MENIQIHHGDCIDIMRAMPENSVDAVVTDPPYGLEFMGADWDSFKPGGKQPQIGEGDGTPFRRNNGTPSWAASGNPRCLNCGGTKYDRTRPNGCSCEAPRFPVESAKHNAAFGEWSTAWTAEALRVLKPGGHLVAFGGTRTWHRLGVAVEDAGFEIRDSIAWLYGSGMPKAKASLKPAFEPIVLGRKPLIGTVSKNALAYGTGSLNVETNRTAEGRWPANVALNEDAADAFEESRFMYVAKPSKKERPVVDGATHATVKPLALMRWLIRLVTPEGGIVLEPFAGSGTTVEACLLEGFNCIAIERDATYLPLIEARIARQAA